VELKRGRPGCAVEIGVDGRSQPAKRCVWSFCIVVDPPVFNDPARLSEDAEDVFIQAFVAQSAIEAFDKGILHWFSGRDVVPADARDLAPPEHGMRCHFRSIVGDNHVGLAAFADQLIQFTGHAGTRQRTIHKCCQRLARTVIHDAQHPDRWPSANASDTKSSDQR